MASDNRNQDKVKLREGEWNNSCFLFLISIAQNSSLSGALWLILVFSVCMGQFVERDKSQFLISPGIGIPWVGTQGIWSPGIDHWTVTSQSGQEAPHSWARWQVFLWVIKCDVSRVFLFSDVFSYWWHNKQTVKHTQHDQQLCLPFSIDMLCIKVCKEIFWWRLINYYTCFIMLTVPWTRKCLMN